MSRALSVIEEGRIYFFYRPRVAVEHPHSVDDIQRFYIIMSPVSRPKAPHRLLVVGKKRLPEKHERFIGFVEAAADHMDELTAGLGVKEYDTATRGHRVTPAARIAGGGVYDIAAHHGGSSTLLAYKLEAPEQPGEVQEELGIKQEATYVMHVKNPIIPNPPGAGLPPTSKARYSLRQMAEFDGYRWIPVRDPSLLDVPHAEFLLILARAGPRDVEAKLGEIAVHLEQAARDDVEHFKHEHPGEVDRHTLLIEKLKAEIEADQPFIPIEPAVEGKWE
ncbi:hypothetical protein WJX72_000207 [[Myrmecia] bisecta]|uniref:Uncharacterized protein n=1 Tax=[Myrmecia] bisecta TaxID=41462 RepID=A0AAW1Q080_9CHLO